MPKTLAGCGSQTNTFSEESFTGLPLVGTSILHLIGTDFKSRRPPDDSEFVAFGHVMVQTHRPKHNAADFANSLSVPHGTSRPFAYRVGFLGVAVGVTASATPPDALPLAPAARPGPATPGVAWCLFPSEFGPGRGRASGSWYPPPFSSSTTAAPPKLSPPPLCAIGG